MELAIFVHLQWSHTPLHSIVPLNLMGLLLSRHAKDKNCFEATKNIRYKNAPFGAIPVSKRKTKEMLQFGGVARGGSSQSWWVVQRPFPSEPFSAGFTYNLNTL